MVAQHSSDSHDDIASNRAWVALLIIGLVACVCTQINYIRLVVAQIRVKEMDVCIRVLNLRIAALVPAFSVLAIISFVWPISAPIVEAVEALVEGMCFFSFFKMCVFYIGTYPKIVETIRESPNTFPCWKYMQRQKTGSCFHLMRLVLFQFFAVRPFFLLAAGIVEIIRGRSPLYFLFIALGIASLVMAMVGLLRLYQTLGAAIDSLLCERKILFIKFIILLFVVQNIVVNGAGVKTTEEVLMYRRRVCAFAITLEMLLFSLFLQCFFKFNPQQETTIPESDKKSHEHEGTLHEPLSLFAMWWSVVDMRKHAFDRAFLNEADIRQLEVENTDGEGLTPGDVEMTEVPQKETSEV